MTITPDFLWYLNLIVAILMSYCAGFELAQREYGDMAFSMLIAALNVFCLFI